LGITTLMKSIYRKVKIYKKRGSSVVSNVLGMLLELTVIANVHVFI
jgi:hypothetical protein